MNNLVTLVIVVASVVLGILYHEYGHLKRAKRHGLTVKYFQIGFGKVIWKKMGKDGVEYRIAWLPFGGSVFIDGKELKETSTRNYVDVLLAGIFRNILFGMGCVVVGFLFFEMASGNYLNIGTVLVKTVSLVGSMFACIGELVTSLFDIGSIARSGGITSQMGELGSNVIAANFGLVQSVGIGFLLGGLANISISIFNALPIPALDGGQVVVRLICDGLKKFANISVPSRKIDLINTIGLCAILGYQGLLFLIDVPAFRELLVKITS